MKLFYKVYLLLISVLILILAGAGLFGYRREVALFNNDMEKDAILLGNTLSGMAEHAWKMSGPGMAKKLIRDANAKEDAVRIRWVDLEGAAPSAAPAAPLKKLNAVFQGKAVSVVIGKENGAARFTYVPVMADAGVRGAVEIAEPLSMLRQYTRNSFFHLFVTAMILFLASGALLWFHFQRWIHQPLVRFIDKSRRIGQGDLTPDLLVTGRDEFAELAQTLNAMCRELKASQEATMVETERRIEAMEQLRHAERLATLGRLSAGMAHEIGTPLNVIAGRAKLIRSGELGADDATECARIIWEQADRITKIMQGLLDFSRRRKPNRTPQDMAALVQRTLDMLAPAAKKAKVSFAFTQDGAMDLVPADPIQIQQVITNLVMNGVQAMPGGGRLTVELGATEKTHPEEEGPPGKYLMIRIRDEGEGIAEEHRPHLFEPFFTTKEVGKGTGLGLSVVYGIVKEHDGWIDVESAPGQGACFIVYLPAEETK